MRGHQIAVKCLAYVDELEYIISGGFDNRIRIWNLGDFSMVK